MLMLECGVIEENIDFNLHIFGFGDVPSRGGGREERDKILKACLFGVRQCVAMALLIMSDISLC